MPDSFETIQEGDEAKIEHIISARDVDAFAQLTGDINPLHMSEDFAQQTTMKQRVVHGMLTASFISTIIGTRLPGKGALWYEQHLRFLNPVRIGETIKVWVKVKHKSIAQRILVMDTIVFNQEGVKVVDGQAKVKVLELEKKKECNVQANKGAVIISGAAKGIGAAIAKMLAADGYSVVVNYLHSFDLAEKLVAEIKTAGGRAIAVKADVSVRQDVDVLVTLTVQTFGSIYGVVNNACLPPDEKDFLALKWEDVQKYIDVQIKGTFNLSQVALEHFVPTGGCIVNIVSIVADNVPPARWMAYNLVKSALVSLTRTMAVELALRKVRVNCVSPGMTTTDMIANFAEKIKLVVKMKVPLQRLGQPEDVAGAVAFLFSDRALYLTGETIRVDGGSVMG